jgi:CheY-like chemotaxis protein
MRTIKTAMPKAKILLVEDNPDGRELLVMVLRREGYEVIEARDGSEALRQATTQYPDLILMDLGLPVMNGDEVTARIKEDPCTAHIPIVVSTAFDPSAPIVKRALAAGADEVIYKPTNFKTLLEVLRRFICRTQALSVASV